MIVNKELKEFYQRFEKNFLEKIMDYDNIEKLYGNQFNRLGFFNTPLSAAYSLGEYLKVNYNEEIEMMSYRYLKKAFEININPNINVVAGLSVHYGITSLGYTLLQLDSNGTKYKKVTNDLNNIINSNIKSLLPRLKDRYCNDEHDLILGISGVGRYLINFKRENDSLDSVKGILKNFISIDRRKDEFYWKTPYELQLNEDKPYYKSGHYKIGLAHGIAGPLALLSIAFKEGIILDGQLETIKNLVDILIKFGEKTPDGLFWNCERENIEEKADFVDARPIWCNGMGGVMNTLLLASDVLGDKGLLDELSFEFKNTLNKISDKKYKLDSPMICHGYAGLLKICNAINSIINSKEIDEHKVNIIKILREYYSEDKRFNFTDDYISQEGKEIEADNISFLNGSTGILTSLVEEFNDVDTISSQLLLLK